MVSAMDHGPDGIEPLWDARRRALPEGQALVGLPEGANRFATSLDEESMMTGRRRNLVLVAAVLAIAAGLWFKRQLEIDGCLDGGGCWDASRGACEHQDQSRCRP
jgi:hypothetical protein